MKKKISQIVAYTVLGVLVIGLILCAVIQVNFKPQMNLPSLEKGDKIQISLDGTSQIESSNDNINYKEFVNTFDNSFKLTILYSFFSGYMNNKLEIGDETVSEPAYTGYKVEFIFAEEQTLKNNGKDVYIAENSNIPITYKSLVFNVADGNGLTNVDLYFKLTTGKYKKVTTIANFDKLYERIIEIPMFQD